MGTDLLIFVKIKKEGVGGKEKVVSLGYSIAFY